MHSRFTGRRVVVTGGAGGMGRAAALRFAAEGADVLALDLAQEDGVLIQRELREIAGTGAFDRLDVSSEEEWAALVDRLAESPPDVLVHCAGIASAAGGGRGGADAYRHVMDVNAFGTMLAIRSGAELMRERGGAIVAIGSVTALRTIDSPALNVGYAASKAAVGSLVRSWAVSEAPHGVRVNALLPGFMPPMRGSRMPSVDDGSSPFLPLIPMGRLGTVDDVAAAALFLASDDAAYITGVCLPVDGGFLA